MNPEHDRSLAHERDSAADSERSALDWARRGGRLDHFLTTFETRLRRRHQRRRQAAAAGLAALIVMGFAWRGIVVPTAGPAAPPASARVLLPARQTLPDGSVVDLRDGADFAVEFTASARRVILRQGVAHFQVAKNPTPFVVVAGGIEVRAVGTAFSVHLDPGEVEVLVTEGRVAVGSEDRGRKTEDGGLSAAHAAGNSPTSDLPSEGLAMGLRISTSDVLVDAGNRIVIPAPNSSEEKVAPQVLAVPEAELAERLAWRMPRLEFSGTPLAEAVVMINRHSRVQLRLGDAQAGRVELSGVLRADNIDPLLRMLEGHYGLSAKREGDTVTLKVLAPPKPK